MWEYLGLLYALWRHVPPNERKAIWDARHDEGANFPPLKTVIKEVLIFLFWLGVFVGICLAIILVF